MAPPPRRVRDGVALRRPGRQLGRRATASRRRRRRRRQGKPPGSAGDAALGQQRRRRRPLLLWTGVREDLVAVLRRRVPGDRVRRGRIGGVVVVRRHVDVGWNQLGARTVGVIQLPAVLPLDAAARAPAAPKLIEGVAAPTRLRPGRTGYRMLIASSFPSSPAIVVAIPMLALATYRRVQP